MEIIGKVFEDSSIGIFLMVALAVLAILMILCLIRAVKGPKPGDRLVGVNMIGTMTMVVISILSIMLGEGYLLDIGLIYSMMSFLAVVIFTKVYIGVYREKKEEDK